MSDNLSKRNPADDRRIHTGQPHEVRYWSRKWKVSSRLLRLAALIAGPMVRNVRALLRRRTTP
ncbi:MAG TPA: DUF3606 domain-containing protein [Chitinophagaceae bacterium]|nr:DUF3606 domain-containing protein [Chitinophagaceae bacterium]